MVCDFYLQVENIHNTHSMCAYKTFKLNNQFAIGMAYVKFVYLKATNNPNEYYYITASYCLLLDIGIILY